MGFVKIHDAIFSSSIIEEDLVVRWVWICLLAACDKNGNVHGTEAALARKANVSLKEFQHAVKILTRPDSSSTSPDYEGRRVVKLGGNLWYCVNYAFYRNMKDPVEEREKTRRRVAKHRAKKKKRNAGNADVTKSNDKAEAYAEAEADSSIAHPSRDARVNSVPFDLFWTPYPRKVNKARAERAWRNLNVKDQRAAMEALPRHVDLWDGKGQEFIPHPTTWLNGRRWEDELVAPVDRSRPGWSLAPGAYDALNSADQARIREEERQLEIRKEE